MVLSPDFLFVLGLVFGVLALPSLISAFSEGRPPRLAALMFIFCGVLLVAAISQKPGGYSFDEIPGVVLRVVGDLIGT